MMEVAKLLLEFVRALAWPSVVSILALHFLKSFDQPIREFFNRLTKVGGYGVALEASANVVIQKAEATAELKSGRAEVDRLMAVDSSPVILAREQAIRTDLTTRGISQPQDMVDVLVKHLAVSQTVAFNERVYSGIFGSQVRLLRLINTQGGIAKVELENLVKGALEAKELAGWTPGRYLTFLSNNSLIAIDGEEARVTMDAVEFLSWMARTGRPEKVL